MDTCERIFDLLDDAGIEQKSFAEMVGTTDKVVSKWRTAGLKSYRKYLPQIADALNTTVEYLLTGEGSKIKSTVAETKANSNAATPEGSGITDEFARIFTQLTPENQNKIIAEMLKRQRDQ